MQDNLLAESESLVQMLDDLLHQSHNNHEVKEQLVKLLFNGESHKDEPNQETALVEKRKSYSLDQIKAFRLSYLMSHYTRIVMISLFTSILLVYGYHMATHFRYEYGREYTKAQKKIHLAKEVIHSAHCTNSEMKYRLNMNGFRDCVLAEEFASLNPSAVAQEQLWKKSNLNSVVITLKQKIRDAASYTSIALTASFFLMVTQTVHHLLKKII